MRISDWSSDVCSSDLVHARSLPDADANGGLDDMTVEWQGVFPAATTQFTAGEALALEATTAHLDMLIRAGVHGLVMLGTVGENCSLSPEEKRAVVKAAVATAAGRVPVIAGVSATPNRAACSYAEDVEALGADGVMVLPAMVYKADRKSTRLNSSH